MGIFHSKRITISLGLVEMLFLFSLSFLYFFLQRLVYIHVYVCVCIMYFIFAVCLISHSSLTECVLLTNFHSKPILHFKDYNNISLQATPEL